jgi:hypothetical protein
MVEEVVVVESSMVEEVVLERVEQVALATVIPSSVLI